MLVFTLSDPFGGFLRWVLILLWCCGLLYNYGLFCLLIFVCVFMWVGDECLVVDVFCADICDAVFCLFGVIVLVGLGLLAGCF